MRHTQSRIGGSQEKPGKEQLDRSEEEYRKEELHEKMLDDAKGRGRLRKDTSFFFFNFFLGYKLKKKEFPDLR